jgi:hypothetical protein
MRRSIFIVILVSLTCTTYSQEKINPLNRNITLFYSSVILDSIEYSREGIFKMLNGKKLEWIQNNGLNTYSFDILWIDGDWTDFSQHGEISIVLENNKQRGKAIFTRSKDGLTITIKQVTRSDFAIVSTFKIKRYEIL